MWRRILAAALFGTALLVPARATGAGPVDANGDGSAIEILGDLAHAEHVAVIVPGVDTSPTDFGRLRAQATALYAAAGTDVAVVAWLGYDPPTGLGLEAARENRAETGAPAFVSYVDGVAAARPDARITVIGHSYGAIVVGLAAHELPAQVTDIVALGAPGMGADDVADLHTTARVWSALGADDWIRRVPEVRILGLGLGTRPSNPEFGSIALPAAGVVGHDGYLAAGSATLTAVAAVVTA